MLCLFLPLFVEINATGFNYQNEDEKVTLSFPSALQKGTKGLHTHYSVVIAVELTAELTVRLSLCTPSSSLRLRHVEDRLCWGAERQNEGIL